MSIHSKSAALALAALLALCSNAESDGISSNPVAQNDGISFGSSSQNGQHCPNSLDLSKACNSANLDLL